jgi:Xaa-Pro aminopeptidase
VFTFASEEIDEKKKRLRALLEELDLSGIYLKKSANFAWVTGGGYNIVGLATEMGVSGVLITRSHQYVVCNNIEAPRMEREERVMEQGYQIVDYPWYDDQEVSLVRSLGGPALGADHAFPNAIDISGKLNRLRYSLTSWEIDRYVIQARETSRITEEIAMAIRPGDEERAVVGKLSQRLWSQGMDFIVAFCAADDRISLFRHPVATDRKIEKRAMISVNSRRRGLIVSITRFIQFGKVPAELRRLYENNVYIDCSMMAATVPGRPASEVFKAALKAYAEKGYPEEYKLHHQGGAIGYFGRDYKVTAETNEIIAENQAFTWNPSITGMKSEDTMLATATGPRIMSEPVLFPEMKMEVGGYTFRRPGIMEL